jgi:hypothetical protein
MRCTALVVLVGCGASPPSSKPAADPESVFAPLEVGADYATYTKLTDKPFLSLDHGNRYVDVYVNAIGLAAYESQAPIPTGTVVVKVAHDGPIYVMEKRAAGSAPDRDDWWYAIWWATPDDAKYGGPIYWRGKSKRVDYCVACHADYDRSLGGLIPSSVLKR